MDLSELRFDEGHAWVRDEGKELIIGISEYAQEQLGDVIFVELPEPGTKIVRDDPFGSIESAKAIEDLVAPVNAVVTRRNDDLMDEPEAINSDPYGDGWLIAVKPDEDTDLSKLLNWDQYQKHLELLESEEEDEDYESDDLEDDFLSDDEEE
ncbi:glycine cleavage system protein GcvH [bacterium]|nr:glycine cleavage system protein GcvH [bacterium]